MDDLDDPRCVLVRVEALFDLAPVVAALARAPRRHRETVQLLFLDDQTVDEALARRTVAPEDRARERDRLYKRRRRALAWIHAEVTRAGAARKSSARPS